MSGSDEHPRPGHEAQAWFRYLSQGETWVPNGKPPLPIADMDAAWRHNAANWLLRQAEKVSFLYSTGEIAHIFGTKGREVLGELNGEIVYGNESPAFAPRGEMAELAVDQMLDEAWDARGAESEAWLKTTTLYQALVAGLPENVAELAKHWSGCGLRTGQGSACSCEERTQ